MKKILIAALALIGTTTTFAQKKVSDVAKLDVETFDFGKIKQNVPAVATFTVTNISSEPIIIEEAKPTCGCTIGDYTKSPILPGKTGSITATYNAAALGSIHKSITLKLNGIEEVKSLGLAGEVLNEDDYKKHVAGATDTKVKTKTEDSKIKTKTENGSVKSKTKKTGQKKTVTKQPVAAAAKS